MRFLTAGQPAFPTVVSCLVIAKDPTLFVPGAWIQFLRIDGLGLTEPIKDQERISGPLIDVLEKLDTKLEAHLSSATDITGQAIEVVHPDYPLAALQQITRNAVLHRIYDSTNAPVRVTWFNDRIEVLSPGGPFGNVTADNFGQPGVTDYRNPHLAEAMRNLGYVQKFGVGIQIARAELHRNGNPEPEFDIKPNFICCTIRKRP